MTIFSCYHKPWVYEHSFLQVLLHVYTRIVCNFSQEETKMCLHHHKLEAILKALTWIHEMQLKPINYM